MKRHPLYGLIAEFNTVDDLLSAAQSTYAEGYRQMTLRGDEVRPITADRIDVSGMTVTVFSGDAAAKVVSVLVSPDATFLVSEKLARGDKSVRIVRDDIDVKGDGWSYSYNEKKVLIYRHAHVVFHSALPDILK